jgi:hypothetical protein
MVGFSLPEGVNAKMGDDGKIDTAMPPLTSKMLDSSIKGGYSHRSLDVATESEKQKKADAEAYAFMQESKAKAEQ